MPKRWKALLVEDEPPARERLQRLLSAHATQVEVVGEAGNVPEALILLETLKPDVLFLDIQLPGMDAFALLRQLEQPPFILFTTAYADYAVRAFEENAVAYLLKPIEEQALAAALQKLTRWQQESFQPDLEALLALAAQLPSKPQATAFPVKVGDRFVLVPLDAITCFEAADKYVYLHTHDGKRYLTDRSLSALLPKLPDTFMQVHRGYVVNRIRIREVYRMFNGRYQLVLEGLPPLKVTTGSHYAEAIRTVLSL